MPSWPRSPKHAAAKKTLWATPPQPGPDGTCPKALADAIWDFQSFWKAQGLFHVIDGVVDPGMTTLKKLNELTAGQSVLPTPPPPIAGTAGVQMGPVGPRGNFIVEYYTKCGLETIGPGQVLTAGFRQFATLEELIDLLLLRREPQHVIVNHGNPEKGLLLRCSAETSYEETGKIIYLLSGLADRKEQNGTIDPANAIDKVLLDGAVREMRVTRTVVLRIVDKLIALRKKQLILHFRACNLTDPVMVAAYKKAFGARMITYHNCRLLFLRFILDQMKPGHTVSQFSTAKNTKKARLRTFDDPIGLLWPMMLAINDIDGHTHVEQESFIERRTPAQILGWATFLLRQWNETAPQGFVIPVMWQNEDELIFHTPLEMGWRQKLKWV